MRELGGGKQSAVSVELTSSRPKPSRGLGAQSYIYTCLELDRQADRHACIDRRPILVKFTTGTGHVVFLDLRRVLM